MSLRAWLNGLNDTDNSMLCFCYMHKYQSFKQNGPGIFEAVIQYTVSDMSDR